MNISAFTIDIMSMQWLWFKRMSLTQTQHCGYCVQQVAVIKMNNIFHICCKKKTKQPAKEQHYRLVNYTQNATGNLPFNLKIYLMIFSHKNQKIITKNSK